MIRVQNIYYMLAYAFQVLQEQGYEDVATEEFENATELLAAILCKGISNQLKRGLQKEYAVREEPLSALRGRIQVSQSIKDQTLRKRQLVCAYDDLTVDTEANRILKAAMLQLVRSDIPKLRKKELKRLLQYFAEVSEVDRHHIRWSIKFNRNDQTYRMLMAISRMVLEGLLQTTGSGTARLMDYLDQQTMPRLYERFILNYFKKEHPELEVSAPQIDWQLDDGQDLLLPVMQSDIVLRHRDSGATLIIDAKYYAHNLQTHSAYGSKTIHSANLYQIFTYVKNWRPEGTEPVSGMLLYAGTEDEVQANGEYLMSGNRISVGTLDMDCDFSVIRKQLDVIAAGLAS